MDRFPAVESVRPNELRPAIELLFHHLSLEDRTSRVVNALHLIDTGELDPASLFVVRDAQGIYGALLCLLVPGASSLVWPPQVRPHVDRKQIEDALLRHACAWLQQRGAKLGQTLLTLPETSLAIPLERNGFVHITRLWYLEHDLGDAAHGTSVPNRLRYRTYQELEDPTPFHQTLLRTYEQSQDCPEVTGVRTIQEIIAGHQAQGAHCSDRWWLALEENLPVGVLLTTQLPESRAWDVSYLGIVPEARRRSLGGELMNKALAESRTAKLHRLTLSVDERNRPARNLYRRLGFRPFDQREVYLAVWR